VTAGMIVVAQLPNLIIKFSNQARVYGHSQFVVVTLDASTR
jgi:hypothetical protein